jgi:hypothetical protein
MDFEFSILYFIQNLKGIWKHEKSGQYLLYATSRRKAKAK